MLYRPQIPSELDGGGGGREKKKRKGNRTVFAMFVTNRAQFELVQIPTTMQVANTTSDFHFKFMRSV
jgi:hypothetical protein